MKWSHAWDDSPTWLLERYVRPGNDSSRPGHQKFFGATQCIAIVEKAEADLAGPATYAAKLNMDPWKLPWDEIRYRAAPFLFHTLKHAQLWCEREVRLMEVGELM